MDISLHAARLLYAKERSNYHSNNVSGCSCVLSAHTHHKCPNRLESGIIYAVLLVIYQVQNSILPISIDLGLYPILIQVAVSFFLPYQNLRWLRDVKY